MIKIHTGKYPDLSTYFRSLHKLQMYSQDSIDGMQGIGKSQFAIRISGGIHGERVGDHWDTNWDKVLHHLDFALKPAFAKMKEFRASSDKMEFHILDDVGAHASKFATFLKGGWTLVDAVNSTLSLARESIWGGISLTSPDQDVMKVLRDKCWLITQVHWYRTYKGVQLKPVQRVAVTYKKNRLPDGKIRLKTYKSDIFTINKKPPKDILQDYYRLKTESCKDILDKNYEKIVEIEDAPFKKSKDDVALQVQRLRTKGMTLEDIAEVFTGKPNHTWAHRKLAEAKSVVVHDT